MPEHPYESIRRAAAQRRRRRPTTGNWVMDGSTGQSLFTPSRNDPDAFARRINAQRDEYLRRHNLPSPDG
jgi:hypothetical protein